MSPGREPCEIAKIRETHGESVRLDRSGQPHNLSRIDGSTDQRCSAIVTNEHALLSESDQPVRKLERLHILYVRGKTHFQIPPHLHNGIWCIVNIGNGYELNNNKGKLTEIYRQYTA